MTIKTIGIVIASTRTNRIGGEISQWIERNLASKINAATTKIEIVDLQKQNLPMMDEAPPKAGLPYVHKHTIEWSEKINAIDAFIFLTPTYNDCIPGGLKNAVDYLYKEWKGKPTFIVSYGSTGGINSNAYLHKLLSGPLGMNLIPEEKTVKISTKRDFYVAGTSKFVDIDASLLPYKETLSVAIDELQTLLNAPVATL